MKRLTVLGALALALITAPLHAQYYTPPKTGAAGGGGGSWGTITGTISDQSDLQAALNAKSSFSSGTGAPAVGACDAAGEVGVFYFQTGNLASVNGQLFICSQIGASSYGWMPSGYLSGTTHPAACTIGNVFFDTNAAAGANLELCTASGVWTAISGGVGAWGTITGTLSAQTDLQAGLDAKCSLTGCTMTGALVGPTSLDVGHPTTSDRIRITPNAAGAGAFIGALTGVDLSANRTWVLPDANASLVQAITCTGTDKMSAVSSTGVVTCSADSGASGISEPVTFTQCYSMEGTTADNNEVTICTEDPQFDSTITIPAVVNARMTLYRTGTAAPVDTDCLSDNEVGSLYVQSGDPNSVNRQVFVCLKSASSWSWQPIAANYGTTAPPACTLGNLFFDTNAAAGSNLFGCTSANTWTLLSGGGGGGGVADPGTSGIMVRTALNVTTSRSLAVGDGTGLVNADGTAGNPTISVDATVGRKGAAATVPAACGNGGDTYQLGDIFLDTATNTQYICESLNHFLPLAGGRGAMLITDDFCGRVFTSGGTGTLGWSQTSIGSGSSYAAGNSGANNPCVVNVAEATDNDGVVFYLNSTSLPTATWSGKDWGVEYIFRLTSAAGNIGLWAGLEAASPAVPASMTGFIGGVFNTDLSHTTYFAVMCDSTTTGCQSAGDDTNQDVTASAVVPSSSTWDRIAVYHLNAGVGGISTYYVAFNNEAAKTFCASGCDEDTGNFPAVTLAPVLMFQNQVAGTRTLDWDYFRMWISGLAR